MGSNSLPLDHPVRQGPTRGLQWVDHPRDIQRPLGAESPRDYSPAISWTSHRPSFRTIVNRVRFRSTRGLPFVIVLVVVWLTKMISVTRSASPSRTATSRTSALTVAFVLVASSPAAFAVSSNFAAKSGVIVARAAAKLLPRSR